MRGIELRYDERMPLLAKLSPPRLFDVAPRERLFSALDRRRSHPTVWVEGPPGAGKTSLVASYLEARIIPATWYQVDAGDADVATLFHYLGRVWENAGGQALPSLPLLTPEQMPELAAFSRSYFREFYARLDPLATLVIDNFQDAAHSPAFVTAIQCALAEVPPGSNVIILSRGMPPLPFARLQTTAAIAVLGWEQLMLSEDEAAQIAGLDAGTGAAHDLLRACGGWVAGLTLMLAHGGVGGPVLAGRPREEVFHFFAAEIFDRANPATRDFLLRSWVLPHMTTRIASEVTGSADAGAILDRLYRSNYFVERRFETESSYQYHALFRSFLAESAQTRLARAEIDELRAHAARSLEAAGQIDDALPLYVEAGAAAQAVRLVTAAAPGLYAQGRIETLAGWIAALPADASGTPPGVDYWRGMCELSGNPAQARASFVRAHRAYGQVDAAGRTRAATGIVDSVYIEWSDFSSLDPWIGELAAALQAASPFDSRAEELRTLAAALVAMLYRQPGHPLLPALARRVRTILEAGLDESLRIAAGTFLLNFWNWVGKPDEACAVIALVASAADSPQVTPLRRAWWLLRCAYHDYVVAEHDAALKKLDEVARLAQVHGIRVVDVIGGLYRTFVFLNQGELDRAAALLREVAPRIDPARRLDAAIAVFLSAWLQALRGDWPGAGRDAAAAVRLAAESGVPNVEGYFLMLGAVAAAEQAGHAEAQAMLSRAAQLTSIERYPLYGFACHLSRAWLAMRRGDPAGCAVALRDGFALGAREGYLNALWWLPGLMSELCAEALERAIEPQYLRRLIGARKLAPPGPASGAWPWPLRVLTLGAFRVECDGRPLRFSGKAQRKPLALLMALIALGGQAVSASRLAEALWPDADGDAARSALGTTLFRLRHLLECEDTLRLEEGKLSLDPQRVWVDAWALERWAALAASGDAARVQAQLLQIYGGHFLEREEDAPWMFAARERWRGLFLQAIRTLGERAERAQDWAAAEQLYRRGIAADGLAEVLYRRLMLCYQQLGRSAEALETYRRCRQALSVSLGLAPAAETEAVRRTLTE